MKVKEFKKLLDKGLGRAVTFLRDNPHSTNRYYNAILKACTRKTGYDLQCEPNRSQYLYELLQMCKDTQMLEEQVIESLRTSENYDDKAQLFGIVRRIAESGSDEARQALYERASDFDDQCIPGFCGAKDLIHLDKEEGLLFYARLLANKLDKCDEFEVDCYLDIAREVIGEAAAIDVLRNVAVYDSQVRGFYEYVLSMKVPVYSDQNQEVTYPEIQNVLEGYYLGSQVKHKLTRLGRKASKSAIEQMAIEFQNEPDRNRLKPYLWFFVGAAYPYEPDRLLEIARFGDDDSEQAIMALKHIQHESVRTFAFDKLRNGEIDGPLLSLLVKNYHFGDNEFIGQLLEKEYTDEELHDILHAVCDIFTVNRTPASLNILLDLFYRGPCSICREECVKVMIVNRVITESIIDECKHDCNPDIRELAKGL
ncbi:MAG: hypothetical protein WAX04_09235 [Oscillospiraceae bacterium]